MAKKAVLLGTVCAKEMVHEGIFAGLDQARKEGRIKISCCIVQQADLQAFASLSGDDSDVNTLISLSPIFVEDSERVMCEQLAHHELNDNEFDLLRCMIAQEICVLARQCGAQARMDGFYVIVTMT